MTGLCLIGFGNRLRGDDAAGLEAVRRAAAGLPPGVRVVEAARDCADLIDAWSGADVALVADAVVSGAALGTVHRIDASAGPIPAARFRASSHAMGLPEAIEIARALGRLPPVVIVYGVEAGRFDAGTGMGAEVEAGVAALAAEIRREALSRWPAAEGVPHA